jgi:hypothetical protein
MKSEYKISRIEKSEAEFLLRQYHYLKDISKGFKSGYNYGLYKDRILVGVCIYTGFPVPELVKGMFGLERTDQDGFFELSRLCLDPTVQKQEHNLASWFISRTIQELRVATTVRSILSYADSDFHQGTVYKACNFVYYGLTDPKSDFWIKQTNGSFIKHSRGKTKGIDGEWRPRSRKHRFVKVFDKSLKIKWKVSIV